MTVTTSSSATSYLRQTLKEHRGRLLAGVALSILQALVVLPVPIVVGRGIDSTIPDGDRSGIILIGLVIVVVTIASSAIALAARVLILSVTKPATARLRTEMVGRVLALARSEYDTAGSSMFHDRIVTETGRVDAMTAAMAGDILPGIALTVSLLVVLVVINWQLTALVLTMTPLILIAGLLIRRSLRPRTRKFFEAHRAFNRQTMEFLRLQDLIRTQPAEIEATAAMEERILELAATSKTRSVLQGLLTISQNALMTTTGALLLVVGGLSVAAKSITLGELISFYAAFALLRSAVSGFIRSSPVMIEGAEALKRLADLEDRSKQRPYNGEATPALDGGVGLRSVTFGYEADRPVLIDVSFDIQPGEFVALVGPNGSGKSSVVNLVLGFYRPWSGALEAGGHAYNSLDMVHLRRSIGVVAQQPLLLSASVIDNLTFGTGGVSEAMIEAALRASTADHYVQQLRDGLDTNLGQDAQLLSGGQRQRLALARALIGEPGLLVLDEPTNHLDVEAMEIVLRNLRELTPRPAVLVVTHHQEVLDYVDRVVRLEAGRVVSDGTPGSLSTPDDPGDEGSLNLITAPDRFR